MQKNIANELGIEHHILDMDLLNQLAPNALTRDDIEIKDGEEGELPSTFVEGRNMVFLTFAAILAKTKMLDISLQVYVKLTLVDILTVEMYL